MPMQAWFLFSNLVPIGYCGHCSVCLLYGETSHGAVWRYDSAGKTMLVDFVYTLPVLLPVSV